MKHFAIIAACILLAGCGSLNQAIRAYGTTAYEDAKQANDLRVDALKIGLCSTPYSAIQRNPEIKPAVMAMCGPL